MRNDRGRPNLFERVAIGSTLLAFCRIGSVRADPYLFLRRSDASPAAFWWSGGPTQIGIGSVGTYSVGKPVEVRVALRNTRPTPVSIQDQAGYFEFSIRDGRGKPLPTKYESVGWSGSMVPELVLEPGEIYTETFDAAYDYVIAEPGRYEVVVTRDSLDPDDDAKQGPVTTAMPIVVR